MLLRNKAALGAPRASRGAVIVRAAARPSWYPGHVLPKYLDGSLPADFGFDPLRLAEDPDKLKWYVQAELMNGRTAMLAVAGILGPELLTNLGVQWDGAGVPWYQAGAFKYFAPPGTLFAIMMFLFAWVEIRRYQDFVKPGSVNVDPIFTNNKLADNNTPGYPGFDPFGYSKGPDFNTYKVKEIKNGRLAMLAFAGFVAQHNTTGTTPLANLSAHLADPWNTTVFQNDLARL